MKGIPPESTLRVATTTKEVTIGSTGKGHKGQGHAHHGPIGQAHHGPIGQDHRGIDRYTDKDRGHVTDMHVVTTAAETVIAITSSLDLRGPKTLALLLELQTRKRKRKRKREDGLAAVHP